MVLALTLLPRVAARQDELGGGLVRARLLTFRRVAPGRGPRLTALGAPAVRVVDRIHGDSAIVRHPSHPALTPGLADGDVHVVGVRNRPDRGHAAAVHQALLGRAEAQDHVVAVAPNDLRVGAGRARDLPALADLELDIVHDSAHRNV